MTEFASQVQSKAELYEVLIRNGWYLPSYKSTAVCEDYLMGVIKGKYYCPKFSDICLLPCFTPPTKEVLIGKLNVIAEQNEWNLGFSDENKPDKSLILILLSTFG